MSERTRIASIGLLAFATAISIPLAAGAAPIEPIVNAGTDPVPDSIARANLSRVLAGHSRLRVVGRSGAFELGDPKITSEGVAFERILPAPDSIPPSRGPAVPWSEISALEVRGNAAGQGAVVGGVTGGLLGALLGFGLSEALRSEGEPRSSFIIAGGGTGAVIGLIGGAIVGAPFRRWTTIYQHQDR